MRVAVLFLGLVLVASVFPLIMNGDRFRHVVLIGLFGASLMMGSVLIGK